MVASAQGLFNLDELMEIDVQFSSVMATDWIAGEIRRVLTERHRLQRVWAARFAETPVILGPGWTRPPLRP